MAVAIDYILPWTQLVVTVAGENVFNTNWTADKETDILVYARAQDEEARDVLQILPQSQYSVFFIGDERLVQVVLETGRNVGDIVTITRDTPQDRMNFFSNTNFTPSMLNGEFARLVMMAQQSELYDKDLSPRYNTSETLYDVDRIIDLYLPKLPPEHIWMKNADNTRIIAVKYGGGDGSAPGDATYIVQTADPDLPNAQALDELDPGVMITDGTGVVRTTNIIAGAGISVTGGTSQADPFVITATGEGSSIITVTTPTPHGLVRWDVIRRDGLSGQFVLAQADNRPNAEVVGIVVETPTLNTFSYQQSGVVKSISDFPGGLTDGECYFLDPFNPGKMTTLEPSTPGLVSKPIFLATGPDEGLVLPMRGIVIGAQTNTNGSNVFEETQVSHGFQKWDAIRRDKATKKFVLAQADSRLEAEVCGLVTEIKSADEFIYQQSGLVENITDFPVPIIDGECYFLDVSNLGKITPVEPITKNVISRPLFLATGDNRGQILPMRGVVVGGDGPTPPDPTGYTPGEVGALFHAREQQFNNIPGGTFYSAAWRTRNLNLTITDNISATLVGNQILLKAGSYYANVYCPVSRNQGELDTLGNRAKIRDITSGTDLLIGVSGVTSENVWKQYNSSIRGIFTLAVDSVIEVQHQIEFTANDTGFGKESGINTTNEYYSNIVLHRLPDTIVGPDGSTGNLAHICDEKPAGTTGGTFTTGVWNIRALNTVKADNIGVTLAADTITMPAGNYFCDIYVPAAGQGINGPQPGGHRAVLYDADNNVELLYSVSGHNDPDNYKQYDARIRGQFTLAVTTDLQIRHKNVGQTVNNEGFGMCSDIDGLPERYTEAVFYDLGTTDNGGPDGFGTMGDYLHFRDEKPVGTDGGGITPGFWLTRQINTVKTNNISATLSSNQITLQPGIYFVDIYIPSAGNSATGEQAGRSRARLWDSTHNISVLSSYSSAISENAWKQYDARLIGVINVNSTTTFEIQQQFSSSVQDSGFGKSSNVDALNEVYTDGLIYKIRGV